MAQDNNRSHFFPTNKYQKKILNLVFIPTLMLSLIMSFLMFLFFRSMIDVIVNRSMVITVSTITDWAVVMFAALWIVVILVLFWAYEVSLNLVGAFERIVRELDDVLKSGKKKIVHARSKDDLANDLLLRINELIKKLP